MDVSLLQFIGKGNQGRVYLLPNGKVIKVFYDTHACIDQRSILQRAYLSRFFPRVYNYDDYSIIMDFINGIPLEEYLKKNKISQKLSFELVELIREFMNLGFTRLDIRLCHIFVQTDESIKIIDPRGSYTINQPYPASILKGLKKYGALEEFFSYTRSAYSDILAYWFKFRSKGQF